MQNQSWQDVTFRYTVYAFTGSNLVLAVLRCKRIERFFYTFRGKEKIMMKLQLISAAIVAYALLATAWICQADLVPLL